jgi:SAM-dependent methyltransferase
MPCATANAKPAAIAKLNVFRAIVQRQQIEEYAARPRRQERGAFELPSKSFASSKMLTRLRPLIPQSVRQFRKDVIRNRAARKAREACAGLSVEHAFETVYKRNYWGGIPGEFYSGTGSDPDITAPYSKFVREFVRERNIRSVVDVGCGDFRVGQSLLLPGMQYIGIDVVPHLIERNTRQFATPEVSFQVVNAIDQSPPAGDLCLIRQVLQHLSNQQILDVLRNCSGFRYLLVSDHLVLKGTPHINVDKPHGPDRRPLGVRLDLPPFSCQTETVLEVSLGADEVIRTVLIEQNPALRG